MINNFVLLKELDRKTESKSGIVYTTDKWGRRCEVINAPEGCEVNIGDTVFRNVGKGTSITLDDEEYEILHINWIIAKINE